MESRLARQAEGSSMRVIGREDFIAMKLFAGGPQNIADARGAMPIPGESLDVVLLSRLAQGFGRDASAALKQLIEETGAPTPIRW